MEKISHNCIKCKKPYKDYDDEDYLCKTCLEEKKDIAKEVDAKFANIKSKRKEPSFDERMEKLPKYNGITIIN